MQGLVSLDANLKSDGKTAKLTGHGSGDKLCLVQGCAPSKTPVGLEFGTDYDLARQTGALWTIRVTVERSERTAGIIVSDDGPGLPGAVRAQLFRGGYSQTGGTGHGLSIARELAERNGGTLRIADVPRGATFIVEVPLDATAADRVGTLYRGREHRAIDPAQLQIRGAA